MIGSQHTLITWSLGRLTFQFENNFRDSGKEKERNLELFARVKSGKSIVDKDKAARNLQAAEEAQR